MGKKYRINSYINCIESYEKPRNNNNWLKCPRCKLKPLVWIFNNGASTACGCRNSMFDYFTVRSESIMSQYKRTGFTKKCTEEELRKNWNFWVRTNQHVFKENQYSIDGRW